MFPKLSLKSGRSSRKIERKGILSITRNIFKYLVSSLVDCSSRSLPQHIFDVPKVSGTASDLHVNLVAYFNNGETAQTLLLRSVSRKTVTNFETPRFRFDGWLSLLTISGLLFHEMLRQSRI